MLRLRTFALKRCWLMGTLLAAALAMRILVPAGFMPVFTGGKMSLALCSGVASLGAAAAGTHGMAHEATAEHAAGHQHPAQEVESPCAFADLSLPVLGGAGAVLLAAMLAFAAVLALLRAPLSLSRSLTRLLPPLRGPPFSV